MTICGDWSGLAALFSFLSVSQIGFISRHGIEAIYSKLDRKILHLENEIIQYTQNHHFLDSEPLRFSGEVVGVFTNHKRAFDSIFIHPYIHKILFVFLFLCLVKSTLLNNNDIFDFGFLILTALLFFIVLMENIRLVRIAFNVKNNIKSHRDSHRFFPHFYIGKIPVLILLGIIVFSASFLVLAYYSNYENWNLKTTIPSFILLLTLSVIAIKIWLGFVYDKRFNQIKKIFNTYKTSSSLNLDYYDQPSEYAVLVSKITEIHDFLHNDNNSER